MNKCNIRAVLRAGICTALSCSMLLAGSIVSYADDVWTMQSPGTYQMYDGSTLTGVVARGIDVSHWQGSINWPQAAADDVDFVMLGTRYKGALDPLFKENIDAADKAGVKIGIYIYSYAMNTEEAAAEADFVLDLIKDYPVSYPIAYDVEDTNTQGTLPKEQLTAIINTFCDKISAAGYYPIIYANDYWLTNKLDMNALSKYDVWVARYNVKHAWADPVMWQATSSGSVSGVTGNVDIDFQYQDFSSKIPANTWRTIADKTYYYRDYRKVTSDWIDDGIASYYIGDNSEVYKGWLTDNGKSYYLDDATGKMTTGWKAFDQIWNYFGTDGSLTKGWIQDGNTWYFADNEGKMQTGLITDGGYTYYLGGSGAMKTGWALIDGGWHYFDGSGAMQSSSWVNDGGTWYYIGKDSIMLTGVKTIDGVMYDLSDSGAMLHDVRVDYDGKTYDIDASGAMHEYVPETAATATDSTAETVAPQ